MKHAGRFLAEERGIYESEPVAEVIEIPKVAPPPSTLADRMSEDERIMWHVFKLTLSSLSQGE